MSPLAGIYPFADGARLSGSVAESVDAPDLKSVAFF